MTAHHQSLKNVFKMGFLKYIQHYADGVMFFPCCIATLYIEEDYCHLTCSDACGSLVFFTLRKETEQGGIQTKFKKLPTDSD